MKKFKTKFQSILGLTLISTVTVPSISSCSKSIDTIIYDCAIEEIKEICKIPHVSNQEVPVKFDETDDNLFKIRNYLVDKINKYMNSSVAQVDDARNVYVDIPASNGGEKLSGIAIQAHMDMVWDANGEAEEWDPVKHPVSQPIIEKVDGKLVMHTDKWLTSLGTDDAQGMGMILSLIKNRDKFVHGPIKCVITADEESTGHGADNLGIVNGEAKPIFDNIKYLINLDLPHGGEVANTAAGIKATDLVIDNVNLESPIGEYETTISLTNFLGGHSGEEIDLGRSSPIKIASKIANKLIQDDNVSSLQLVKFESSCEAMNKIPSDAKIVFVTENDCSQICAKHVNDELNLLKEAGVEKTAKISTQTSQTTSTTALDLDKSKAMIKFFDTIPFGPQHRFEDDGFVGSSINISPLKWEVSEDRLNFLSNISIRFGTQEWFNELNAKITSAVEEIAKSFSGLVYDVEHPKVFYPVWELAPDQKFTQYCIDAYKKYGIESKSRKSHGGLEPAHILANYPHLTAVSMGATDLNEHMSTEQLVLDEYKQLTKVLLDIMKNLNI